MVNKITVDKIINGYVVKSDYIHPNSCHTIYFKDMKQLVNHLDDCFVKPYDKIEING